MKLKASDIKDMVLRNNKIFLKEGYIQKLGVQIVNLDKRKVVQFYRESILIESLKSIMKSKISDVLTIQGAVDWLESFYPPQYGFSTLQNSIFPNGFESWHETHFEIVKAMELENEGSLSCICYLERGTGGMYELAKEMTDEFEFLYMDFQWNGEYNDKLTDFCRNYNL